MFPYYIVGEVNSGGHCDWDCHQAGFQEQVHSRANQQTEAALDQGDCHCREQSQSSSHLDQISQSCQAGMELGCSHVFCVLSTFLTCIFTFFLHPFDLVYSFKISK